MCILFKMSWKSLICKYAKASEIDFLSSVTLPQSASENAVFKRGFDKGADCSKNTFHGCPVAFKWLRQELR
jgi:hypothetical protein